MNSEYFDILNQGWSNLSFGYFVDFGSANLFFPKIDQMQAKILADNEEIKKITTTLIDLSFFSDLFVFELNLFNPSLPK